MRREELGPYIGSPSVWSAAHPRVSSGTPRICTRVHRGITQGGEECTGTMGTKALSNKVGCVLFLSAIPLLSLSLSSEFLGRLPNFLPLPLVPLAVVVSPLPPLPTPPLKSYPPSPPPSPPPPPPGEEGGKTMPCSPISSPIRSPRHPPRAIDSRPGSIRT